MEPNAVGELASPGGALGDVSTGALAFDGGSTIGWLIVAMVALLGVAAFVQRRSGFGRGRGGARELSMIASLPLGDKRAIVMVQARNERLLVGVTPQSVQLISRLETEDDASVRADSRAPVESRTSAASVVDESASSEAVPETRSGFGAVFSSALGRGWR